MQPFRLVNTEAGNDITCARTCELISYDSAQLNVFAAELSYCQPHWYEAPELIYLLSGTLNLTVNQQELALKAGDFAYISADLIHSLEKRDDCALLTLQFSPALFSDGIGLPAGFARLAAGTCEAQSLALQTMELLQILVGNEGAFFILQAKTYALLALLETYLVAPLITSCVAGGATETREQSVIRQSIAFINDNYSSPVTVSDLADSVFLSYSHFSRLFKKVSGYSPSDYLAMVRVNHAKPLLKNMHIPITEIAEKVGFAEHRAMLAAFKKYCDMTPTEYRKQYYADFAWRADDVRLTPTPNKPLALPEALKCLKMTNAI